MTRTKWNRVTVNPCESIVMPVYGGQTEPGLHKKICLMTSCAFLTFYIVACIQKTPHIIERWIKFQFLKHSEVPYLFVVAVLSIAIIFIFSGTEDIVHDIKKLNVATFIGFFACVGKLLSSAFSYSTTIHHKDKSNARNCFRVLFLSSLQSPVCPREPTCAHY